MDGKDVLLVRHLDRPMALKELALAAKRHPSRMSRVVPRLERMGLVEVETRGRTKRVRPSHPAADLLGDLLEEYPRVQWPRFLSPRPLQLVSFFSTSQSPPWARSLPPVTGVETPRAAYVPKTAADASDWLGTSPSYTFRLISAMTRAVILRRAEERYFLSPEHETLRAFAALVWETWSRRKVAESSGTARLLWQQGPVALFADSREDLPLPKGGATLLGEFGVALIAPETHYLIAPWEPSVADAILQTFLAAPTRSAHLVYACIAYAKWKPANFFVRARQYGIENVARLIDAYVSDPASIQGGPFPPPNEFEEMARAYGVG